MKDKHNKILISTMILLVTIFSLFFITLILQKSFFIHDYILFCLLLVVLLLTLLLGQVPGLLLCTVVIFGYGSIIFVQMLIGSGQIWTLNYLWFIAYPITTFFAGHIADTLNKANDQCANCLRMTERIVTIDEITGFGNGREFLRDLDSEMSKSKRHKIALTVAVLEIQYFDELVAIYGNDNTKKIYKVIAEALNRSTRIEDLRFRIDVSMLALVLPHTSLEDGMVVKKRIRENLSKLTIEDDSSLGRYNIEVKIGMVEYNDNILNPMEYKSLAVKELEYDV